jgi:RND family efflux transporter MFP subunit
METEPLNPQQPAATGPAAVPAPPAGAVKEGGSRARGPASKKALVVGAVVVLVIILIIIVSGKRSHTVAEGAATVVATAPVTREDLFNHVTIPAEFRPYVEVELHAMVSGYVDRMNVDFGDKVKAGQLLATLEVPELQDELHSAVANFEKAEVDYTNAHLMYTRLEAVNRQNPNLVAQQDLDTAQARDGATAAAIAAAKADQEKYQTLVGYTQIAAPFDGVVTGRYADPGALIQAGTGSDTGSKALLRVSDNYHLRLDFPVSVLYVKDIHAGDSAEVRVDSLGGKTFSGTITRFTDKVSEDTRTMMVELEIANPNLEIVPGMYAAVDLKVQRQPGALAIPVQAIADVEHPSVYVVNGSNEIEARPVTLGIETPDKFEITLGLKEGELVMIGNRAFVHPGEKVETKLATQYVAP